MGLLFYDSRMGLPHLCGSFQTRVPLTCTASEEVFQVDLFVPPYYW